MRTATWGQAVEMTVTAGMTGEGEPTEGNDDGCCSPEVTGEQANIAKAARARIRLPDNPARSMAVVGVADQGVHVA